MMRWPDFKALLFTIVWLTALESVLAAPSQQISDSTSAPDISQKLELPVPVGEPVKGIKIPQYDESGKMTMCLTAESAKKLNENQVELNKLKVQFDEKEAKQIIVEIPHSILNLETKILTADSETKISRDDFDIMGSSAIFNTITRQGSFKGHVEASFENSPVKNLP